MIRSLLSLLCAAAVLAPPLAQAGMTEVRSAGTLRVLAVLDPNRPEFFSLRADLPPGFDHEILQGFADLHRVKLQVVSVPSWAAESTPPPAAARKLSESKAAPRSM